MAKAGNRKLFGTMSDHRGGIIKLQGSCLVDNKDFAVNDSNLTT